MRQRFITGIFFVAAMLGGLLGGPLAFYCLFSVITVGCLWEYYSLTLPYSTPADKGRRWVGTAVAAIPFIVSAADQLTLITLPEHFQWHLILPVFLMAFVRPIVELFIGAERPFDHLGHLVFGMLYICMPMMMLAQLYYPTNEPMPMRILGVLLLTWTNDTFAYLIGRKIGRNKLYERISPGKTWEGTIGGAFCTLLLAFIFSFILPESFSRTEWMIMGCVAAVFATTGDLVESMLKRSLHVKDSSGLLPGHGGMLDRFDALLYVVPFGWLALKIVSIF
jgi:phosphatidate cytidylyltransferase